CSMSPTEPQSHEVPVVVVGAGPSGLTAAAALKRRSLDPVLLERDERVGGRWAGRYERLHLHTVRRFSGLAYHPMPSGYPRYVPKDLFARYLEDYADHFDLDVRLGQAVLSVRPEANGRSGWVVGTDRETWHSRAVVIATGNYNEPL